MSGNLQNKQFQIIEQGCSPEIMEMADQM